MPWRVGHVRSIIAKYNEFMELAHLYVITGDLVGFILQNIQIIPNQFLYGISQKRHGLPH